MHGDAGSQRISLSYSCDGTHATIALGGWLDAAVAPMARAVVEDLPEQVTDITFDCRDLEYVSSAGIRVLMEGARRCRKAGGTCSVLNVDPIVMSVLGMIDASKVMRIEQAEAPEKPEEEDLAPQPESQSGGASGESGDEEAPASGSPDPAEDSETTSDSHPDDSEVAESAAHSVDRDEDGGGSSLDSRKGAEPVDECVVAKPSEERAADGKAMRFGKDDEVREAAPDGAAEEEEWRGLTLREILIIVAALAVVVATLLPSIMKALDDAPREDEHLGSAPKTYAEAMQSATSETFADM